MAKFEQVVLDEQVERDVNALITAGLKNAGADIPASLLPETVAYVRESLFGVGAEGSIPPRASVVEYVDARNAAEKAALAVEKPAKKQKGE